MKLTDKERAEFEERFPGVLETKFQVESKEFPVPSVTKFVGDEVLTTLQAQKELIEKEQ